MKTEPRHNIKKATLLYEIKVMAVEGDVSTTIFFANFPTLNDIHEWFLNMIAGAEMQLRLLCTPEVEGDPMLIQLKSELNEMQVGLKVALNSGFINSYSSVFDSIVGGARIGEVRIVSAKFVTVLGTS